MNLKRNQALPQRQVHFKLRTKHHVHGVYGNLKQPSDTVTSGGDATCVLGEVSDDEKP